MINQVMPRPYVAIDTEFSGVEEKDLAELFEVAMVFEDFQRPVSQLPYFWGLVSRKRINGEWLPITYAEPYALLVNFENGILQDIIANKPKSVEHEGALYHMRISDLQSTITLMAEFADISTERARAILPDIKKLQLAGKNVETDLRVIEGNARRASLDKAILSKKFDHRTMDPGKAEARVLGYNPGSDEMNARYNFGVQPHRALFDALNVVKTIRKQFNIDL